MAATIQRELGVDVELIKGDKGIFDVVAEGETIFSKHEVGRFPEEEEVLQHLRPA